MCSFSLQWTARIEPLPIHRLENCILCYFSVKFEVVALRCLESFGQKLLKQVSGFIQMRISKASVYAR